MFKNLASKVAQFLDQNLCFDMNTILSIIIVNFETPSYTGQCIESAYQYQSISISTIRVKLDLTLFSIFSIFNLTVGIYSAMLFCFLMDWMARFIMMR